MPDKELSRKVINRLLEGDSREDKEIAKELGISSQRLGHYRNGKRFPGPDFIHSWKKTFGHDLMELIEKEANRETNVSHETKKLTPAIKTDSNDWDAHLRSIGSLVEEKDYRLLPNTILEQYHIIPKTEMEANIKKWEADERKWDEMLKSKNALIERLEVEISGLERENNELKSMTSVVGAKKGK